MGQQNRLWAIVLAAGDGKKLASMTARLYGQSLPKQFATLSGDRSLLQQTVDRLLPLVPLDRIVSIVPRAYEEIARDQLAASPGIRIVTQPANRGTGPGVLLPLAHVLRADSDAHVVVAPSDHHFRAAERFNVGISAAARRSGDVPLTLIGAEADRAETDYGWIEQGEILIGDVRRAVRFVEKPGPALARNLLDRGFIWNTFTMVARACHLWDVAATAMPVQAALIRAHVERSSNDGPRLDTIYDRIEEANFSRCVLERAPHPRGRLRSRLRVLGLGSARTRARVTTRHRGARSIDFTNGTETASRRFAPGRTCDMRSTNEDKAVDMPSDTGGLQSRSVELIAVRAYQKWQARGCPEGDGEQDWLEAEREILDEGASHVRPIGSKPSRSTT